MKSNYSTSRLTLTELAISDHEFITKLVNTPGWIQFIGDRHIQTQEDAIAYIQKNIDSPGTSYWVVKLKDQCIPIGVITFMKRDHLEHHDIGFAFLPEFGNQGYAFEAANAVLYQVVNNHIHTRILATTLKENNNSIKLLEKLGLAFEKEIKNGNTTLSVYGIAIEKLFIGQAHNN